MLICMDKKKIVNHHIILLKKKKKKKKTFTSYDLDLFYNYVYNKSNITHQETS